MAHSSVCIIGMGLLGGSLGMALRQRGLAGRVVGVARRPASLERALEIGAIDDGCMDPVTGVAEADLTFLCVPVLAITKLLRTLAPHVTAGGIVTDVGSTKAEIVATGESLLPGRFLGGHPMAGSEQAGIEAADARLFEGASWALTPGQASAPVEPLAEVIAGLGARPLILSPEEHDCAVAATSHLPHAAAAALARVVADALVETPAAARLAAGSYRDTTRVAASGSELWRDVFLTNREPLLAVLERMQGYLAEVADAVRHGDAEAVERFFLEGRDAKARVERARRKG